MFYVLGAPFGLILFNYGKSVFSFINQSLFSIIGKNVVKDSHLSEVAMMWRTYTTTACFVCSLINLICMFQDLSDPNKIGAGIATALLPFFYATLFSYFVLMPLEVEFKESDKNNQTGYTPPAIIYLLVRLLSVLTILLALFILLNVLS